jgi:hypothetical protein
MRIDLTEVAPTSHAVPDELAMYLLNRRMGQAYPTADDAETNALFAIDASGASGGELSVFAPMRFAAPDSLILDQAVTAVDLGSRLDGRLRVTKLAPNPAGSTLTVELDVPAPGGRLIAELCDVAGRRIARLADSRVSPGRVDDSWRITDGSGRPLAAGIYFLQFRIAGQSVVRKVAVTR